MNETGKDEVRFIDAETYAGGMTEKLTFREIVLGHLKKIGTFASVEFRGGYWEERPAKSKSGFDIPVNVYIADSREVYSNSVEFLADVLYVHFDKKMREAFEKAKKETKETLKNYTVEREREDKTSEEGKEEDRRFGEIRNRISYRTRRRIINRELFRALCCFLKRQDYLKGKTYEEKV